MSELLRVENLTKVYPNGFVANENISFDVRANEIHALVGENGAGKTTLMKMLFGMEDYQTGSIYLNGKKVSFKSPLDAIHNSIGMIHQHFMLVPSLTIAENIMLGIEPVKGMFFDYNSAVKKASEIAEKFSFDIDVTKRINEVSVGLMQKVEILKALIRGVKILIMDEPTAVLTPQETRELFEQLLILKKTGYAVIFISHKLEEVMELCDRVTVLRKGRCVGTWDIDEVTQEKLSNLMVGREVSLRFDRKSIRPGKSVMRVENAIYVNQKGKLAVNGVSLNVREGEVLGIAGIEGNGQSELSRIICGAMPYHDGRILLNDTEIKGKSARELRKMGLAHIPEDRMKDAVSTSMSISDNIIADRYFEPRFHGRFFMKHKEIRKFVEQCIKDFEIACDGPDQPVRMLSGGNIQKVVVAREFTSGCSFILASQPTRGIDVGTAEMIRRNLISMAHENNVAVLLISADLTELIEVSDRILVMRDGSIVGAFPDAKEVTDELLGEYMLGIRSMSSAEMEGIL